jgi:hypothetical protein
MSRIGGVTRMPIERLVDIRQAQRRFEGANVGYAGKPTSGPLENKADHLGAFKQKGYKQKAFNSDVDSTAHAQLADMLVGEIELPVRPDTVDQMWKLQVLLHRKPVVADVRVLCVDSAQPAIAE